ncbi:PP2C family protein-serine/threonine phosphatase [Nocardioides daphniae]|uniref:PP2C family protein-serine/threonine phosphatase n=1 Tax=Nocardioides daphniae TaxID=402297 RepID=UPI0013152869|nr:PP2C family protein-serine/threonine phosphatase [Nocardioides daphniae]
MEALLPSTLGLFPSLCVSGRYVLGGHDREHSGSGLKATHLPDGRIALAVTEASGGGAVAATTTARLLAVLYARLEDGANVRAALAAVDRYARRTPFGPGATMAVAVVDPANGVTEVGIAGHPAPLRLTDSGQTLSYLLSPSRPLGTGGVASTDSFRLEVGDTLLLFTNGLLTASDGLVRDGITRLEEAPGALEPDCYTDQDALADRLLRTMQRPAGFVEDVAMVVAQRCAPIDDFHFGGDLAPGEPQRCTAALSTWLDDLGVSLVDHVTLQQAVSTIVSSVVDSHPETVRAGLEVTGTLTDEGVVEIRIHDASGWQPRGSAHEHGLVVAGGLVDHLRLFHDDHGTVVVLRQPVGRTVPLMRSVAQARTNGTPTGAAGTAMTSELRSDTLRVSGAVTATDDVEFREALHEVTCSCTRSATVDLSGVTRMPGHVVRTLFDYLERASSSQVDLTVVTGEDSVAAQVLTQAALPHVTT